MRVRSSLDDPSCRRSFRILRLSVGQQRIAWRDHLAYRCSIIQGLLGILKLSRFMEFIGLYSIYRREFGNFILPSGYIQDLDVKQKNGLRMTLQNTNFHKLAKNIEGVRLAASYFRCSCITHICLAVHPSSRKVPYWSSR